MLILYHIFVIPFIVIQSFVIFSGCRNKKVMRRLSGPLPPTAATLHWTTRGLLIIVNPFDVNNTLNPYLLATPHWLISPI